MSNAHLPREAGRSQGSVLVLGSSLTIMGSVMVAPIIPKLIAEFAASEPRVEVLAPLAITGPALAIAIFAPLAGWLADSVGRKFILIFATLLYALLGAAPALLNDLQSIVIARFLFGCSEAMVMTCCTALIADYWQGERRLRYINAQVISIALVGALFFVIGGALGEQSWRTPFYLYLLPLLLVIPMMKVLWEPLARSEQDETPDRQRIDGVALVVGYVLILGGMVLSFVVPVQTPRLMVQLGIASSTLIGMATGAGLLASLVGALAWPLIRKTIGIKCTNALLLGLMSSGLMLLINAGSLTGIFIAVVIHGVGAGLLVPNALTPVMNALNKRQNGRGMGGFTSCLYLGQFVSPLCVAFLMSITGRLTHAIAMLALIGFGSAVIWLTYAFFAKQNDTPPLTTTADE
ncbi:MFS transporter [Halomonas janggokensis]|uniref:MFS-type drug efflux transporter P55 n=1 Tax=Vreelandella janggokensis TaxID=370767 RepID=A0ABT4ISU9_9GAMM|nr:MFS transporter [Halomonas janggokensis]MCZ0926740.1 MFS transporter [Halomonas janggokensis]MCZ0929278.1 MFS transporter [Halomonas janggokensis]